MKSGKIIAVMASLVVMLMATTAPASLVLDIRTATGGTSVVVTPGMVNTDVTLYVWANVTGVAAGLEGLNYAFYSVKSTPTGGGALSSGGVTVAGSVIQSPFTDASATGTIQELTIAADGVIDVGSNSATPVAAQIKPRAVNTVWAGGATGEAITDGWRWNVQQITFHIPILSGIVLGSGSTTMAITRPTNTSITKGATWYEDGVSKNGGNAGGYGVGGTSVVFTLEATQATANAGGVYAVHYGIDGSQSNPLNGSGAVTKGFGAVSTKKWDLDGDGTFETTQLNGSIDVTYNQLKGLGYQYDTAKAATFQYKTNDGVIATDVAMVTIMPDTVVAADAGGPYTVDKGTDGELVFQLHGSGMVISGDGVVMSKMWDLDGNGLFETTQTGDFLDVTYNMLKAMGYVDNVAKEATFRAATDTNRLATGSGSITLLPEPATMALLGLGGLALAIRRRRAA